MLKKFEEFVSSLDEDLLLDPEDIEEEDDSGVDIDLEFDDEEGNSLDNDEEEFDDSEDDTDEKARPPRLKKRQRATNAVKSAVTRRVLGPNSPVRSQIEKIFKTIRKEIKKEAKKKKVPIGRINLDRITIKR